MRYREFQGFSPFADNNLPVYLGNGFITRNPGNLDGSVSVDVDDVPRHQEKSLVNRRVVEFRECQTPFDPNLTSETPSPWDCRARRIIPESKSLKPKWPPGYAVGRKMTSDVIVAAGDARLFLDGAREFLRAEKGS